MEEQRGLPFEEELRQALRHLDDPCFLRQSKLVALLGLEDEDDPAAALRSALEQAIEAFKPISDTGSCLRKGRHYEILWQRYVRRLPQKAVAQTLAITPRYLRREQAAAIRALAGYLALRYDLREQMQGLFPGVHTKMVEESAIHQEMLWLADSFRGQTCEVNSVLSAAVDLVQDLARQHAVRCMWQGNLSLPPVRVPGIVLKQVILNLLMAVIHQLSPGGRVDMAGQASAEEVILTLSVTGEGCAAWLKAPSFEGPLAVTRQLLGVFKGDLSLSYTSDMLVIRVVLPCAGRQVLVLAIEDNLDTIQLWRRYTQKTRFSLVAETDPEQAIASAARLHPDLIVLDIMLPGIDGWDLLKRLRADPATASIPVIVCTVLPQKELAFSLGARDFIPKPTTGEEFRAALERQISAATLSR